MEKNDHSFKEMKIFSNKLRRDLLKKIARSGSISFTNLKEEMDLTDGRLYFHLKKIDYYLEKDEENHYRLNKEGKRIFNQLFHSKSSYLEISPQKEEDKEIEFLNKIAPANVFYYLYSTKIRSFVELSIALVVISWLFGVTGEHFSALETILTGGAIVNAILSLVHWYIYLGIIIGIIKIMKKELDVLELSIGLFTGVVPYFIYLIPVGIIYLYNLSEIIWLGTIKTILFIICKIWSVLLITQGITISTKIKNYQSFMIALVMVFLDYLYMLFKL